MSLLIQSIGIGVIAFIIQFFSSDIAQWIVWLGFLFFAIILFFKGLDDRNKLKKGQKADVTGAMVLPIAMALVTIILIGFLFTDVNRFHLLWIAPLVTLIVELIMGKRFWDTAEKELFKSHERK